MSEEKNNILKVLHTLQKSIHVPKDKRNNFGQYNYRTAEGILQEVQKCLPDNACIIINDDIVVIGNDLFLKATARLLFNDASIDAVAFAGLELVKKGMDKAQATGAASSYARKYALQGLLSIGDGRNDPDYFNKGDDSPATSYKKQDSSGVKQASDKQKSFIVSLARKLPAEVSTRIKDECGVNNGNWATLTTSQANALIKALQSAEQEVPPPIHDDEFFAPEQGM